jgi:hypothetical protein
MNTLNDDILLGIFSAYRLDDQNRWNDRLGWCKLSHVCQRWRHLVYSSAFHLDVRIQCTYGTPMVDTLDHLPFLPLVVDFSNPTATMSEQDELGLCHALQQYDRLRSIDLTLPASNSHKFLMLMDQPLPILEFIRIVSISDDSEITMPRLQIPKTFLAPNLHSFILDRISPPKGLSFLSSTVSLVFLTLNVRTSHYLFLGQLVARLQSLPQLESLAITFHIPRSGVEREPLDKQGILVTLPNLKRLSFNGVSAYLECLVAQIKAPRLESSSIILSSQRTFALPHLALFTNITEELKLPTAEVHFWPDAVYVSMDKHKMPCRKFSLGVTCKQLDQQIDCATQICRAIVPVLSHVKTLGLRSVNPDRLMMQTEWQEGTVWHELLRPFFGIKELRICRLLSQELSFALQEDDVGSDPGFLPGLRELVSDLYWKTADDPFDSFLHARQFAGRSVHSVFLRSDPSPRRVRSGRRV